MKATAMREVEVTLVLSGPEAEALCELMRRVYVDVDGAVRLSQVGRHTEIPAGFDSKVFTVITNALEGR